MKQTSHNALIELLKSVNGASFISIDTQVEPVINKTLGGRGAAAIPNPHFGRITKTQSGSTLMVFQNKTTNGYENMVHRRLIAEGKNPESFKLGERQWGTRLENLPVVEHNGKYYLEVIFLKPGPVQYFLDGQPIAEEQIQGMRTSTPEQGGLEDKVIIRTFGFDSITTIRIDGTTFTLK